MLINTRTIRVNIKKGEVNTIWTIISEGVMVFLFIEFNIASALTLAKFYEHVQI